MFTRPHCGTLSAVTAFACFAHGLNKPEPFDNPITTTMTSWEEIRQLFTLKTLWVSANIVFTALLAVQLSHVLQGYIKPQNTRTWDEYARLEDLEFPLVIKICISPGFNQTALREVGYEDTLFSWRRCVRQCQFNIWLGRPYK